MYLLFQGTIDQFNYPRKGKNIPPPREMMGDDMEQEYGLYDENGQPQKFID